MKYRWALRPVEKPAIVAQLQRDLNDLPEALARSLALRGIETLDQARAFFRGSLSQLHDPFLMKDMKAAADRVVAALQQGERILVYGDYDVDGTTATALMTRFLRDRGADVDYFIPDRIEDGYGLGTTGIDYAADRGTALIIALDCGITALEEARYARQRGIDLIICDHHTPLGTIPEAVAVLDPKRDDCRYPFKELSGCGVGFKLVQAVLLRLGKAPELAFDYLDLVAVSTASDIVPVCGENRVLLREGLSRLQERPSLGLRVLAEQAGCALENCSTSKVVFSLGPRINAAGRMGDARRAVALLLSQDEGEATALARQLEGANSARRALDQETQQEAQRLAERQLSGQMRHSVVLYRPEWHPGVIGIVASRLVERFYRPAVMLCAINGEVKGSARSVSGVNIYDALKACEDLLIGFGGHDYAAGLSLEEANVPDFQRRFDEAVRSVSTREMLEPVIEVDAPLQLGHIDERFWAVLKQFAPFGPENNTPVFHARGLEIVGRPRRVGASDSHLKFRVRQAADWSRAPLDVIGFSMGKQLTVLEESQRRGQPVELLFSIEENEWRGQVTMQLRARDLRLEEHA